MNLAMKSYKSGAGTEKLLNAITARVGVIDFEMSFVRDEREANFFQVLRQEMSYCLLLD